MPLVFEYETTERLVIGAALWGSAARPTDCRSLRPHRAENSRESFEGTACPYCAEFLCG
jgi:hypothetical protein